MEQALRAVFDELASAFSALDFVRFRALYLRQTPDWRIVTRIGHTPGRGVAVQA